MVTPFSTALDAQTGIMQPHNLLVQRHLSELTGAFADEAERQRLVQDGNPVIYRAWEADVPHEPGELVYRTTVIYPGRVGQEFHLTKGHHHTRDSAEFYYGMSGTGQLVMQSRAGQVSVVDMPTGTAVYVPAGWAHRTVNVGDDPMLFLAVFAGDAGHDYASIEESGFLVRVFAGPDGPNVVRVER
jgi:glucose-6-phosphate isomerase